MSGSCGIWGGDQSCLTTFQYSYLEDGPLAVSHRTQGRSELDWQGNFQTLEELSKEILSLIPSDLEGDGFYLELVE